MVFFNLTAIPTTATVQSATLTLTKNANQSTGTGGQTTYAFYQPNVTPGGGEWTNQASWDYPRGGTTYNWFGGGPPGAAVSQSLSLGGGNNNPATWTLDVPDVQGWVSTPANNFGALLKQVTEGVTDKVLGFESDDNTNKPTITVNFTLPAGCSNTPPSGLPAANVYVSSLCGSDASGGTTWATRVQTMNRAFEVAGANQTIVMENGDYGRFTVPSTESTLTIKGQSRNGVVVKPGTYSGGDVVTVNAPGTTLTNLTVRDCRSVVPGPTFPERDGAAGVRIAANSVIVDQITVHSGWNPSPVGSEGQREGCHAILAFNTNGVRITNNDLYDNGAGVSVYGGTGGEITANKIHDNTHAIIRNTEPFDHLDFGAVGVTIHSVLDNGTSAPAFKVDRNVIYNNTAPSYDYTFDGGGLEVFAASDVLMEKNIVIANDTVYESGSNVSGAAGECANNVFRDNTVFGYTTGPITSDTTPPVTYTSATYGKQLPADDTTKIRRMGMVLRCAKNMLITGNEFTDIEHGVFFTVQNPSGDAFARSIDQLKIQNNQVLLHTGDIFHVVQGNATQLTATGVTLGGAGLGNRYHFCGTPQSYDYFGKSSTVTDPYLNFSDSDPNTTSWLEAVGSGQETASTSDGSCTALPVQ